MLFTSQDTHTTQVRTGWLSEAISCGPLRPEDRKFLQCMDVIAAVINSENIPVKELRIDKIRDPEEKPRILVCLGQGIQLSQDQRASIAAAAVGYTVNYINIQPSQAARPLISE